MLLLCIAPFLLLVFLPFAARLINLPAISERTLTSAAVYAAPVCGLIGALAALDAENRAQAAVSLAAGVIVLIVGKATSPAKRADGSLARIALLALAADLATTGQQAAYPMACLTAAAGIALPSLLRRLPDAEIVEADEDPVDQAEADSGFEDTFVEAHPLAADPAPPPDVSADPYQPTQPEQAEWPALTHPQDTVTAVAEPAPAETIVPLDLGAVEEPVEPAWETAPSDFDEQPPAEEHHLQPLWSFARRRSAHLLDRPQPQPPAGVPTPPLLGEGSFHRIRRTV